MDEDELMAELQQIEREVKDVKESVPNLPNTPLKSPKLQTRASQIVIKTNIDEDEELLAELEQLTV